MEKRVFLCAFVGGWLIAGCVSDEGGFHDPVPITNPANPASVPVAPYDIEPEAFDLDRPTLVFDPVWRPRWHPQGTLLVDGVGELWMTGERDVRLMVSGDDSLGNVSLDESDAIPMTPEEERCLAPNTEQYWGSGNESWWPVYGPHEDDPGPFILDWGHHIRRPVSHEVLESWGYYWRWMDWFDGGEDEWLSYAFVDDPIPFRDGSLARTELGSYYLLHGRAYLFRPAELALEAGYRDEDFQPMSEARLRTLAIVTTSFTRETFETCPADEAP